MFWGLLYNSTLLIAVVTLYSILHHYEKATSARWRNFFMGLSFGIITVVGMHFGVHYSQGLFYDGRSVILSMAGLFGGWAPAVIAAAMAALYRVHLGGIGMYAGIASIISSAALGALYRKHLKGNVTNISLRNLLVFGIFIHLVVILWQAIFLPWPSIAPAVLKKIGIPYIIILPLATLITGILLKNEEHSKMLEKEKHLLIAKLQETLMPLITTLIKVVGTRDSYTASHQLSTAQLACAIAEELGMSKDRIEGLRLAAQLHDIGKINIPSEILNKPGKLSDVEFELIKNHVKTGYEILKDIAFPWPIARIVLEHHERENGSGYPNGLRGKDLLLESKILAVADVIDAMSHHRPYRPALGIDVALKEIEKNKGILYDPQVVEACLRLFREKGYVFNVDEEASFSQLLSKQSESPSYSYFSPTE